MKLAMQLQPRSMLLLHRQRHMVAGLPTRHAAAIPALPPATVLVQPSSRANWMNHRGRSTTTMALPVAGMQHLLADTTLPILKIVLCCGVGAVCAKKGLINLEARRTLSRLAIDVFTPALMISKLGAHIDLQHALALWPIGANVIICHLVGLMLGRVHTQLLPPSSPHLARIIQVSTAISNVGNLPLVMVMSFVKNPNLPFNSATEAELAVSYVMLGWFYATMVQMPLGHWLLHKHSDEGSIITAAAAQAQAQALALVPDEQPVTAPALTVVTPEAVLAAPPVPAAAAVGAAWRGSTLPTVHLQHVEKLERVWQQHNDDTVVAAWQRQQQQLESGGAAVYRVTRTHVAAAAVADFMSHGGGLQSPEQQKQQQQQLLEVPACCSTSTADQHHIQPTAAENSRSSSSVPHLVGGNGLSTLISEELLLQLQQKWRDMQPLRQGAVSAPLLAGLVAIGVGSFPVLRDALFTPGGSLSLIGDCLDMLGQPLIPVLLLVLGANLANGPGPGHLPIASVAGVIGTRLLLLPLLGCCAVLTAQRAGLISMQDPLALVVMMVAWSTPTAILVHSLASVHKNGEDEVSALLFWEYLACIVTLPLCSAAYLYLIGCCMSYTA